MTDLVGQQLGNYRLIRLLGRGGFAEVYLGEHIYLKSHAALKVLHTRLTDEDTQQFVQEAQTLARLSHPHIVRLLDFSVQEGTPFLAMEYAPGGTLRTLHPKGSCLALDTIIPYVTQVAEALQYAHNRRLIHRDVKPENMLLGPGSEVLLSDFGLAMLAPHTLSASTQAMDQSLTGTIAYLAPEQLQGKPRPASDQYALGIVVYEWLCGTAPFRGSPIEVAMQHLSVPPASLQELLPDLAPAIEEVVLRALAKEPELRFTSVQDFATALQHSWHETLYPPLKPELTSQSPAEGGQSKSSTRHLPTGTVTLLFSDIEGSTRLLQQLDERYALMLAEYRQLLRHAFEKFGGHEVDTQGDAFFGVFARATDAVAAAVTVQRTLTNYAFPEGVSVRVRMGLHTGEPELSTQGYVGLVVHSAARIMGTSHGGQILLSQTTRGLVDHDLPEGVSLRDLGEHRLKDLQRPERLFQLVISGLPADFPPLKTLENRPSNLPTQATPFIGREKEMATVRDLLCREDVRLLTLTGVGGTGKTRLALQVAAELCDLFTDGAYFVNLAPISDPEFVVPTIAQALSIREVAGQPLLEHLKEELQQKQLLLVLDNFEQVVTAAPGVLDLLAACPKLKVLVTSRKMLRVRAEHEFTVPPLALPDPTRLPELTELSHYAAVALFIQRAQAVQPDFQMTPVNARAIAEICVRLDGLPLAIELATTRVKLLSPQALLARLNQRLQILTNGARDAPIRQQSLRNNIAWSYDLLTAEEQRLFRRLSVFVGGCTLEAVEGICAALDGSNGTTSVLDGVVSLIDKSLLQQAGQQEHELRLMMLEMIREYGLEMLKALGEMEITRQAHAAYFLALAEGAQAEISGPQQAVWLGQLEQEHDNLRAALQWSLEQGEADQSMAMALPFSRALTGFWRTCGHYSEGRTFLKRVLAGSKGSMTALRAEALNIAAGLAAAQGDYGEAEGLSQESLALSRELEDARNIASSLSVLADVAVAKDDSLTARTLMEEALALYKELRDKKGVANALFELGWQAKQQEQYPRARAFLEEALVMVEDGGDTKNGGSMGPEPGPQSQGKFLPGITGRWKQFPRWANIVAIVALLILVVGLVWSLPGTRFQKFGNGTLFLNSYCQSLHYNKVTADYFCASDKSSHKADLMAACNWQYPKQDLHVEDTDPSNPSNPNRFLCYASQNKPEGNGRDLNVIGFCQSLGYGTASYEGNNWMCVPQSPLKIDLNKACQMQYNRPDAIARHDNDNGNWECYEF